MMKIRYDPDADALYIKLLDTTTDHTKEIDKFTILDFDVDNNVIGMEFLFVKERNPNMLKNVQLENISVA